MSHGTGFRRAPALRSHARAALAVARAPLCWREALQQASLRLGAVGRSCERLHALTRQAPELRSRISFRRCLAELVGPSIRPDATSIDDGRATRVHRCIIKTTRSRRTRRRDERAGGPTWPAEAPRSARDDPGSGLKRTRRQSARPRCRSERASPSSPAAPTSGPQFRSSGPEVSPP
jgi:hypothetical protein